VQKQSLILERTSSTISQIRSNLQEKSTLIRNYFSQGKQKNLLKRAKIPPVSISSELQQVSRHIQSQVIPSPAKHKNLMQLYQQQVPNSQTVLVNGQN